MPIINEEAEQVNLMPITKEEVEQTNLNSITPLRTEVPAPRIKLFNVPEEEHSGNKNPITEVIPLNTDLEVLLINSCKIDAIKVQTIVEDFMANKKHTTIFCMTETKVEGHDFQPVGVKIFSKHRNSRREKKGGGPLKTNSSS